MDRDRFLAGPKSKVDRKRAPLKTGIVRRAAWQNGNGKNWSRSSERYCKRLGRTDIHDLLEHLVVASKQGSWTSDEDSDSDEADVTDDLEDIKVNAAGMDSITMGDMDLRSFTSQFNRKGVGAEKRVQKKRMPMVRFDSV